MVKPPSNERLLYRMREAGEMIGASTSTMYRLAIAGKIEMVKAGRATLVTGESLRRYVASLPRMEFKRDTGRKRGPVND